VLADIPPDVDELIARAWKAGATDLLLTVGSAPFMRIDSQIVRLPGHRALTRDQTLAMARGLVGTDKEQRLVAGKEIDFSFSWRGAARVRGNAYLQRGDVTVALRMIPRLIPSFDDIGLPEAARRFVERSQGFVLMTGPTGSGKSTTLASMVGWINQQKPVHILTIEDPIEFVHDHASAAVSQREVGSDTESFADALRAAMRESPDVIMVGEMRDLESIQIALTLAETGHLVLSSMHTNDTAQAIDRMIDVFPAEHQPQSRVQLAGTLAGGVHQRLLPRIGGGMIAAFEIMVATPAVRNLIKEGRTDQLRNTLMTGQRDGMQTLEAAMTELVATGRVAFHEAKSRAGFPKEIPAAIHPALPHPMRAEPWAQEPGPPASQQPAPKPAQQSGWEVVDYR
jgi:twitching motility protein PilT